VKPTEEPALASEAPAERERAPSSAEPLSPTSKALAPHVPTNVAKPKDIGGGYKELTCGYMESLIAAAANPATPCQLIDAKTYKQLAKTILAVEGDDRKQLVVWALGHGNTGIKQYVKSSKAKEVLAGLKLCELLMAQVGVAFAAEIVTQKWADRLYTVFYDTAEPILKMTIAQHIADWLEMFHSELDVKHLRNVAKKIAKNALTNGGYGIPKPTAMALKYAANGKVSGGAAAPKENTTESPAAASAEPVDDAPVRESASPAPAAPVVSDAAAKRADVVKKCFERYDLDKSGTINTEEEMQQLCTNLCFKLKLLLPPGEVEKKVAELGDMEGRNFNLGEFAMWFDEAFDQKSI